MNGKEHSHGSMGFAAEYNGKEVNSMHRECVFRSSHSVNGKEHSHGSMGFAAEHNGKGLIPCIESVCFQEFPQCERQGTQPWQYGFRRRTQRERG